MKHIGIAAVAALVLIAGASVADAITSPAADALVQEIDTPSDGDGEEQVRRGLLGDVLDRLVADQTLSQDQADAVEEAVREEVAARKPLRRAARRGAERGYRLGRLLADDVIDAAELETLPDEHPLRDPDGLAAPYLDDGQLTIDELKLIRRAWKESRSDDG